MPSRVFQFLPLLALAALSSPASGQAAAEYGLGAARAATTAAPMRNAANGIAGVFDNLSKAAGVEPAAPSPGSVTSVKPNPAAHKPKRPVRSAQTAKPNQAAPAEPPAPAPVYEDPKQIQAGLAYDELVRRFGPPSMSVTAAPGSGTVWYATHGAHYQVELEQGKVVAASGTTVE